WAGLDEDEDAHVWEDNWDDDNVEDDFSNQLRRQQTFQKTESNVLNLHYLSATVKAYILLSNDIHMKKDKGQRGLAQYSMASIDIYQDFQ
ncbi:hypothetical protein STEG23_012101, partial [Scotinomys teguina]